MDIDRLHENVEKIREYRSQPRQEGRTTAIMELMIGEIELGDPENVYLFIGQNIEASRIFKERFAAKLVKRGILFESGPERITILKNQQRFFFKPLSMPDSYRGLYFSDYWIDVSPDCVSRFGDSWKFIIQYLENQKAAQWNRKIANEWYPYENPVREKPNKFLLWVHKFFQRNSFF